MVSQLRVRFYREFLTPALHRRFSRAAGLTLLVCYVEAIAIGDKSSRKLFSRLFLLPLTNWYEVLWSWFPIGPVTIRTLLLFIAALLVFLLRVAQMHFGCRTTDSSFDTFKQYLFRFNTLQTLVCYFFSAWWFSEVYIWSMTADTDLQWVAEGK